MSPGRSCGFAPRGERFSTLQNGTSTRKDAISQTCRVSANWPSVCVGLDRDALIRSFAMTAGTDHLFDTTIH